VDTLILPLAPPRSAPHPVAYFTARRSIVSMRQASRTRVPQALKFRFLSRHTRTSRRYVSSQ